jgi:hypothetical protein
MDQPAFRRSYALGFGSTIRALHPKAFVLAVILSATGVYVQSSSVSLSGPAPANSLRRFEVGGQTADLHFNVGYSMCPRPEFALGVSGAWNLNPSLAERHKHPLQILRLSGAAMALNS